MRHSVGDWGLICVDKWLSNAYNNTLRLLRKVVGVRTSTFFASSVDLPYRKIGSMSRAYNNFWTVTVSHFRTVWDYCVGENWMYRISKWKLTLIILVFMFSALYLLPTVPGVNGKFFGFIIYPPVMHVKYLTVAQLPLACLAPGAVGLNFESAHLIVWSGP